jgi:hypothetical protein
MTLCFNTKILTDRSPPCPAAGQPGRPGIATAETALIRDDYSEKTSFVRLEPCNFYVVMLV